MISPASSLCLISVTAQNVSDSDHHLSQAVYDKM